MYLLEDLESIKLTQKKKDDSVSEFVFEPLLPGYGMTVGHALRRVILTSLEGSAISYVRIEGVDHEFSTIKGVKEDAVEIILNLKNIRVRSNSTESVVVKLDAKGPGQVTVADFKDSADIEFADKNHHIATLDKGAKLSMEVTIERGSGYVPTEAKDTKALPIGTIAIDSVFTPIKKVHYEVQKTRVGGQTDYDKLVMELTTDGTVAPEEALADAAQILIDHFNVVKESAEQLKGTKAETKEKNTKKAKKTTRKAE